jgi:hypothetical protein
MEKIVGAVESGGDPGKLFANVRDDYWSHHFTLAGKAQARPTELIGATRTQEIVANIALPFVAALDDERMAGIAKSRYDALPAAPSNSVVRLAGAQLLGPGLADKLARTARRQQGLMQVFQDFCLNDKSGCRQCQFPELVRRWAVRPS